MAFARMTDLDLRGKRVLIREDLNAPVKNGRVTSDARLQAALPTLRAALAQRARVLVLSHLGRPKEGAFDPAFSLRPVAARLAELLGRDVPLVTEWLDGVAVEPGDIVLCENVRFLPGEEATIPSSRSAWPGCATFSSWMLSLLRTARRRARAEWPSSRRLPARGRC
jgi:phosphoglycerate kinase